MDIWHFDVNNQLKLTDLTVLPKTGYVWVNCETAEVPHVNHLIEQLVGEPLHDSHIEDCLNTTHPCSYDTTSQYDILIFHNLISESITKITTQPNVFLIFEKLLVTINHQSSYVPKLQSRLQATHKRLPDTPSNLAYFILNFITDQFLELRKPLSEYLLKLQGHLLKSGKPFRAWDQYLAFKGNIHHLSMVCEDQHDAIEQWRQDLALVINHPFMVRLNDLLNHSLRAARHARMIEAELETLVELHYSVVNHHTNEIMRTLTVIACIFLPLNFATGFFGMNFEHMSILRSSYGYYGSLLGMGALSITLLIILKWKKWI